MTSPLEGSAKNFSRAQHPDHALRYRIADEYLQVVKGLWDSWEEDAFVRNKASGQFFDKINCTLSTIAVIFSGCRPAQYFSHAAGRPIIFRPGPPMTAKAGGASCRCHFTHQASLAEAQVFYHDVKNQLAAYGRQDNQLHIFRASA